MRGRQKRPIQFCNHLQYRDRSKIAGVKWLMVNWGGRGELTEHFWSRDIFAKMDLRGCHLHESQLECRGCCPKPCQCSPRTPILLLIKNQFLLAFWLGVWAENFRVLSGKYPAFKLFCKVITLKRATEQRILRSNAKYTQVRFQLTHCLSTIPQYSWCGNAGFENG